MLIEFWKSENRQECELRLRFATGRRFSSNRLNVYVFVIGGYGGNVTEGVKEESELTLYDGQCSVFAESFNLPKALPWFCVFPLAMQVSTK